MIPVNYCFLWTNTTATTSIRCLKRFKFDIGISRASLHRPSAHPTLHLLLVKRSISGCRHSSVDSSAPSILLPRVQVPSTPSMFLSIYIDLCHEEKTKINKKAGIGPFFKRKRPEWVWPTF